MTSPAEKARILANAQSARHKPSRVMRKRAVLLTALELSPRKVGAKKVIKQRLGAL